MTAEKIEALVIGGGQAGLAASEHLSACSVPHLVLEKGRIAEHWRSRRWDSLVANGPAWHDRFPGLEFDDVAPDAFAPKERVATYFEQYVEKFELPVRSGVEVTEVTRNTRKPGFHVATSEGEIEANYIVAATGPFQKPIIPPIVPEDAGVLQIHSCDYRNPGQLPDGGVLVVGGGASGSQIADELLREGRQVHLSIGPHSRYPRWYRGHDYCWWLGVLGQWDIEAPEPGTEHVTIAVSGAYGGYTVDFRPFAERGMTLMGMTKGYADGVLSFAPDLAQNMADGDAAFLRLLDDADAYVERSGLDLPDDPEARQFGAMPDCVTNPVLELNLAEAGINSIVWATGYGLDYSWLKVDAFDAQGKPDHKRGVSSESGVYFLGLPWLSRRGSSFIWGVWHDARYIAHHIATHRGYMEYHAAARG
ncbi:MAG: NAD(P)/FAD-dependent oxidoreductase [Pseudomonadota bacterium]